MGDAAAAADDDGAMTINDRLQLLPDAILALLVDLLSFDDRHKLLLSTCRELRQRSDTVLQSVYGGDSSSIVQLMSTKETNIFQHIFLHRTTSTSLLLHLDLSCYCTDDFLHAMAPINGNNDNTDNDDNQLLPNLQSISLVNSQNVTDRGLLSLSKGCKRAHNLLSINITYCYQTTYYGTYPLRDALVNLKLLRRQPEWLDGSYETPFENDGLHTYYADGTFVFERQKDSIGYIVEMKPWPPSSGSSSLNPYFVYDKLQYSNFEPPQGWPLWTRYCYRPGVSLLKMNNNNNNNNNGEKEVLVGQSLRGLKPPTDYPRPEHIAYLSQPKTSCYFDRHGNLLSEQDDEHERRRCYMVSRMRVFPLSALMPPKEPVEQNRTFFEQHRQHFVSGQFPFSEQAGENALHEALSE